MLLTKVVRTGKMVAVNGSIGAKQTSIAGQCFLNQALFLSVGSYPYHSFFPPFEYTYVVKSYDPVVRKGFLRG